MNNTFNNIITLILLMNTVNRPLASDVSMWEDKFEKMKVITEIIFCINAKEKFKGTLVLESLTIE